jgi:YggT family protein
MLTSWIEPLYLNYWFYFIPDWILSMVMWTCLGRILLNLFVPMTSTNYIWRFFCRITDPACRLVARITPAFVVPGLMPLVAAFWLMVARYAFWLAMYNLELAPRLSDYGIAPGT